MGEGLKRAFAAAKKTRMSVREKLIENGVKNLKEFGYPDVDAKNILTDYVFRKFFRSMLEENRGHGRTIDDAINELVKEIDACKESA